MGDKANGLCSLANTQANNDLQSLDTTYWQSLIAANRTDDMRSYILDLVEVIIKGVHPSASFVAIVSPAPNSLDSVIQNIICDGLWFWGTQTASDSEGWNHLCHLVKEVFSKSIVPSNLLKLTLEMNLLTGAGLASDENSITKRLVKLNTGMVYRQQKYNILREETEGFAHLIAILSSLPTNPSLAANTINQMLSTIGHFDLDPNRVLDLLLDMFEHETWNESNIPLIRHFRRSSIAPIIGLKFTNHYQAKSVEKEKGPETEGTASENDKANGNFLESTPATLCALCATLMAYEMIDVTEILPYLAPSIDETVQSWKSYEAAQRKEILSIGVISLATANADAKASTTPATAPSGSGKPISDGPSSIIIKGCELDGDERFPDVSAIVVTNTTTNEAVKPLVSINSPEFAEGNQIIGLITALLGLRCWSLALKLIATLEERGVTVAGIVAIREALISLATWRISDLLLPVGVSRLNLSGSQLGNRKGLVSNRIPLSLTCVEKGRLSFQLVPSQVGTYPSLVTFPADAAPLLSRLGLFAHQSPKLISGICRILKAHIEQLAPSINVGITRSKNPTCSSSHTGNIDPEAMAALQPSLNIITEVLLPAMSSADSSAYISSQIWEVLELFPFQIRFNLYELWKSAGLGKDAIGLKPYELVASETKALHNSRATLKRLSKENTKVMGRTLARYSHNCPLIVYNYILNQIESFDNMIPIIVDALRYSTQLSRDVMAYLMVVQLHKQDEKLKKGDTNYSQWFSSLSRFIATYYKRYPQTEIKGLFHYLLERLAEGDSIDLLVLKELLAMMGGCETLLELSTMQLEGLAGGRVLRSHVVTASVAIGNVSNTSIRMLREELMSSGVALPMLIFIAQIRTRILHCTDTPQLKLISHFYDTAQDVLMQFTDFLVAGAKNTQTICAMMPSIASLINDSGLSLPVAFQLTRPLIRAAFQSAEDISQVPDYLKCWHPFSPEICSTLRDHLPTELWSVVSVELVVLFWSLSLYDLAVPNARYENQLKRLKERYAEIDGKASATESEKAAKQRKIDMTKVLTDIKELTDEWESQKKYCDYVRRVFESKKESFFIQEPEKSNSAVVWGKIVTNLLQHCVLERLTMSPGDALFSIDFFFLLHDLEATGFSTIVFVHQLILTVSPLMFCSTEAEASFIGYAFSKVFNKLNNWYSNKSAFQVDSQKYGFLTFVAAETKPNVASLNQEGSPSSNQSQAEAIPEAEAVQSTSDEAVVQVEKKLKKNFITFDKFQLVCLTCWKKFKDVLTNALNCKEYIFIRSALILLSKIVSDYPILQSLGQPLLDKVQQIEATEDDRGDIKLMAKSLVSMLKKQSSNWKQDVAPKSSSKSATKSDGKSSGQSKGAAATTTAAAPATGTVVTASKEKPNQSGSGPNSKSSNNNNNNSSSSNNNSNNKRNSTSSHNNNASNSKSGSGSTSATSSNSNSSINSAHDVSSNKQGSGNHSTGAQSTAVKSSGISNVPEKSDKNEKKRKAADEVDDRDSKNKDNRSRDSHKGKVGSHSHVESSGNAEPGDSTQSQTEKSQQGAKESAQMSKLEGGKGDRTDKDKHLEATKDTDIIKDKEKKSNSNPAADSKMKGQNRRSQDRNQPDKLKDTAIQSDSSVATDAEAEARMRVQETMRKRNEEKLKGMQSSAQQEAMRPKPSKPADEVKPVPPPPQGKQKVPPPPPGPPPSQQGDHIKGSNISNDKRKDSHTDGGAQNTSQFSIRGDSHTHIRQQLPQQPASYQGQYHGAQLPPVSQHQQSYSFNSSQGARAGGSSDTSQRKGQYPPAEYREQREFYREPQRDQRPIGNRDARVRGGSEEFGYSDRDYPMRGDVRDQSKRSRR